MPSLGSLWNLDCTRGQKNSETKHCPFSRTSLTYGWLHELMTDETTITDPLSHHHRKGGEGMPHSNTSDSGTGR
jgi:hypothetical protein